MMISKFAQFRQWIIAFVISGVVYGLVWMLFIDTNHPREVSAELFTISGKREQTFSPGETIRGQRMFCVDKVSKGVSTVEAVDLATGKAYLLSTRDIFVPEGCSLRSADNKLPDDIPEGLYQYRNTLEFRINPLRTIVLELPPLHFQVKNQ